MKTVIVNVPEKKENYFLNLFKKHHLKTRVIERVEDEDLMENWIDEGMESEDIPEEEIFKIFRKYGIKV
ncbi:MAG: hypothetical protein HY738_05970 [Bacteroidia bacterium]|nr:hypothetical protein [Bacteroidia bacterium]